MLADEIVSGLDVSTQAQILTLLEKLAAEMGLTVAFISHDLSVIRRLCRQVIVMRNGVIVEAGADRRAVRRTAACLHARPDRGDPAAGDRCGLARRAARRGQGAGMNAAMPCAGKRAPAREHGNVPRVEDD